LQQGEAWNNIGSVYLKLKKKREAFLAYQEALKEVRNDWRIWQNFLYTAVVCLLKYE
jgi:tetratricopeptide (TPR) repeat protein